MCRTLRVNLRIERLQPQLTLGTVGYTSVAVTACETDHYILVVFVVMSKEEGSMYRGKLHIPIVLGRMGTSQTSVKTFREVRPKGIRL